jgi:hypothetical protein
VRLPPAAAAVMLLWRRKRNCRLPQDQSEDLRMKKFKRYCKTLQLENDAELIEEYKKLHAMGNAWPEITRGMKDVGIIDMEIYLDGTTLFMIMDTEASI